MAMLSVKLNSPTYNDSDALQYCTGTCTVQMVTSIIRLFEWVAGGALKYCVPYTYTYSIVPFHYECPQVRTTYCGQSTHTGNLFTVTRIPYKAKIYLITMLSIINII